MAHYDPNDPNRVDPNRVDPNRVDPKRVEPGSEPYVAPVEKRASPLPLIIGILLALALAYFVLQRFMGPDDVVVDQPDAVVVEDAPDTTIIENQNDPAAPDAVVVDETPAVPAEPAADPVVDQPADATPPAVDSTGSDTVVEPTEPAPATN